VGYLSGGVISGGAVSGGVVHISPARAPVGDLR